MCFVVRSERGRLDECRSQPVTQPGSCNLHAAFFFCLKHTHENGAENAPLCGIMFWQRLLEQIKL